MSVVINLVSPDTSWIMSDGLVIDGETGKKVSGSTQKFQKLHRRLIVGYTGVREFAEDVVDRLKKSGYTNSLTVELAAKRISALFLESREFTDCCAQFLVTGISDNRNFATYIVRDGNIEQHIPNAIEYRSTVICKHSYDDLSLDAFIEKESKKRGGSAEQIVRRSMTAMVKEISLRDSTVNTTVFFDVLHR